MPIYFSAIKSDNLVFWWVWWQNFKRPVHLVLLMLVGPIKHRNYTIPKVCWENIAFSWQEFVDKPYLCLSCICCCWCCWCCCCCCCCCCCKQLYLLLPRLNIFSLAAAKNTTKDSWRLGSKLLIPYLTPVNFFSHKNQNDPSYWFALQ